MAGKAKSIPPFVASASLPKIGDRVQFGERSDECAVN